MHPAGASAPRLLLHHSSSLSLPTSPIHLLAADPHTQADHKDGKVIFIFRAMLGTQEFIELLSQNLYNFFFFFC